MSGGHWNYRSHHIEELAHALEDNRNEFVTLIQTVAQSERIMDWALSCDTSIADAKEELWNLWERTFDKLYAAG